MKKKLEIAEHESELTSVLGEIDTVLKRQNSLGFIFIHGVVRGTGTALGATLLVAVATSLTLYFADSSQADVFMHHLMSTILE